MNRDGGAYSLPTAYDRLLVMRSTSRDHKPLMARNIAKVVHTQVSYNWSHKC